MKYIVYASNKTTIKEIARFDLLLAADYFIATFCLSADNYVMFDDFEIMYLNDLQNARSMRKYNRQQWKLERDRHAA